MNDLTEAYDKAWNNASLLSKAIVIIETDIIISAFHGEATTEDCEMAHRIAVRSAERIIKEIKKEE